MLAVDNLRLQGAEVLPAILYCMAELWVMQLPGQSEHMKMKLASHCPHQTLYAPSDKKSCTKQLVSQEKFANPYFKCSAAQHTVHACLITQVHCHRGNPVANQLKSTGPRQAAWAKTSTFCKFTSPLQLDPSCQCNAPRCTSAAV